jgi:hypothetical protein
MIKFERIRTQLVPAGTIDREPYTLERLIDCVDVGQLQTVLDRQLEYIGRDVVEFVGIIERDFRDQIMTYLADHDYEVAMTVIRRIEEEIFITDLCNPEINKTRFHYILRTKCDIVFEEPIPDRQERTYD